MVTSMSNSKHSETISRLSSTTRNIPQKPIENQERIQGLLNSLRSIKERSRALKAQEEEALAELTMLLEAGDMEDAKDCGEERWLGQGITLTRQSRTGGWTYSPEAVDKIKLIQQQDIDSGLAARKPDTQFWRAQLAD